MMYPTLTIFLIIFSSGIFGGIVNFYYINASKPAEGARKRYFLIRCIVSGTGAAFLVPLFLYFIQSGVLKSLYDTGSNPDTSIYFIFAGFCLAASISAFKFINMISDKLLKDLKTQNTELEGKAQEAEVATEAMKAFAENQSRKISNTPPGKDINMNEKMSPPEINWKLDDPCKGMFGGLSVSNERKIYCKTKRLPADWYKIDLFVTKTDESKKTLTGEVQFFLHPTFDPKMYTVKVENGIASDSITAWGAFTVGVIILEEDGTQTRLELDLTSPEVDASKIFKSR